MSLYQRLADLPLEIEGYTLEPLELPTPAFTRHTTVIRLRGGGHEGVGEDVTYQAPAQAAFQQQGPVWDLSGRTTLDAFSHQLDRLRLFDGPVGDTKAPLMRRWAFESAALDLALRQAGRSLADVLERPLRPLRFVVSTGLRRSTIGVLPSASICRASSAMDNLPRHIVIGCRPRAANRNDLC